MSLEFANRLPNVDADVIGVRRRHAFTRRDDGSRGQHRYTDIWIGRDGRWQALTAQITPLAMQPPEDRVDTV